MVKKILFIITKSEMGGAQRFLYELITHLNPSKYALVVAAGSPLVGGGELFNKLSGKNIAAIKIKNFSNVPGIKNLMVFFELLLIIIKTEPDIIYLLSSEAGFVGSLAGKFYRLMFWRKVPKIIYRIGGWAFKEPKNIIIKKFYFWAEKISAPFKDIIITNSEFDRHLAIKNKMVKENKIITIYNGIDFERLKFLPRETAKKILLRSVDPISFPLVGTIANFYKNKGLEYLIGAVKKFKEDGKNYNFVIIGDGPEKHNIEELIKKYGLENTVHLTGMISDAYKFLKSFDLLVLPSVKEGQPWVILEAMAAEVPIVATNIAGIPETIENEKSGFLVEPADSIALANAIEKTLTHPSLAQECVRNALNAVKEKFNIEKMIIKNEELFL